MASSWGLVMVDAINALFVPLSVLEIKDGVAGSESKKVISTRIWSCFDFFFLSLLRITAVKMKNALKQVGGNQKVRDKKVLDVLNTKATILLMRVDDNTIAANTIVCTHQGCSVGYNKNQKRLDCPCHGSRFDLNGKVLRGPAGRPLTHFKATIQGDSVLLEEA